MTVTQEKPRMAAWLTTLLGALWLAFFPLWQDGSYTRITRAKWVGMLWLSGMTAARPSMPSHFARVMRV